jgi:hypothetical protein
LSAAQVVLLVVDILLARRRNWLGEYLVDQVPAMCHFGIQHCLFRYSATALPIVHSKKLSKSMMILNTQNPLKAKVSALFLCLAFVTVAITNSNITAK